VAKKNRNRNIGIVVAVAIIAGGSIFFLSDGVTGELEITLPPPPLSLFTSEELRGFAQLDIPTGGIPIENIECKIKQRLQVFDLLGNLQFQRDSVGLAGTPFIPALLTDPSTFAVVSFYKISLLAFCTQAGGGITVILPSSIGARIQPTLVDGSLSSSLYLVGTGTKRAEFGNSEIELISFMITQNSLETKLSQADYSTNITFSMFGTLKIAYKNFETFAYDFPIFENNIQVKYTANVLNAPDVVKPVDSDGDGIPDNVDDCPFLKEDGFGVVGGFPDPSDGCPAPDIPPPPPVPCEETNTCPPPNTCESTNDPALCRLECQQVGGTWVIDAFSGNAYCNPNPPACPVGQVLINNQCVVPPEPPILDGEIKAIGKIVFKDNTIQSFTVGTPVFLSGAGSITPLQVTSTVLGESKGIERFEYELYFVLPSLADGQVTFLEDSDILFTPTVIVSSAEQRTGTAFEQQGATVGRNAQLINGIGSALTLGKGLIRDINVQALVTQVDPITGAKAPIGEGVAKKVKIRIDTTGDFTLQRDSIFTTLILQDSFIQFAEITIDNRVDVPPIACRIGFQPTFDIDGKQIGCEPIPPTPTICFTPLHPLGFACGASYIGNFCPDRTDLTTCTDPDRDGDGFPDEIDPCPDDAEDGLPPRPSDGCPADTTPPCPEGQVCDGGGDNGNGGSGGGTACLLENPLKCLSELDTTTLLIFGAVGLLALTGIVVIARRR